MVRKTLTEIIGRVLTDREIKDIKNYVEKVEKIQRDLYALSTLSF